MTVTEAMVRAYEEAAEKHDKRRETRQRDLCLVLAADAAFRLGQRERAERLRLRLLALNPHHLLKPFPSLAEALRSPDIQRFVEDLRRQHPPQFSAPAKEEGPPPEPLKILWQKESALPAKSPPAPPSPRPAPPPAPVKPAPVTRPTNGSRRRDSESPYGQAPSDAPAPRPPDGEGSPDGGWIAVAVFVLCLIGFLALAGYTLVRPVIASW